jgi:hypothetical protein
MLFCIFLTSNLRNTPSGRKLAQLSTRIKTARGFFFRLRYVFSRVHLVDHKRIDSIRFLQQKFRKYHLIYVRANSYWRLGPREYKKDQYREATV